MMISASGLPNSVARYIAIGSSAEDPAIVRSAIKAAAWPAAIASLIVAITSGVLLKSPLACLFAAMGLSSLVYSLLATGILRGRDRLIPAVSIMPITAFSEVGLLAAALLSGARLTPLFAFGIFCAGNVMGLLVGLAFTIRTAPPPLANVGIAPQNVPTPRQMLGFSLWLSAATIGIAILPLVMRLAATIDSYTVVALIDVVLVLLSIPQRMGTVIVSAVVPHAARALNKANVGPTISRRENLFMAIPFVVGAIVVAFTPIVGALFDALGRPEYAQIGKYLALALLAGPARVLYGLVEGVLVARGEGRFLALNALSIAAITSVVIFAATALGSTLLAFAAFVAACWAVYIIGLTRITRLSSDDKPTLTLSQETAI